MATELKTLETFEHKSEEILPLFPATLSNALELRKNSSLSELAQKADKALSKQQEKDSGDIPQEALRLTWLFAQIKLRQLPASALYSTLIELSPYIEGNSEMAPLAQASYAELSRVLEEKSQKRLAIGVLEEAAGIVKEPNFLLASLHKLDELISEELSSLEDRRAPLSERTNLEQKQKEYRAKGKKLKKTDVVAPVKLSSSPSEPKYQNPSISEEAHTEKTNSSKALSHFALICCALLLCAFAAYRYLTQEKAFGPKLEIAKPIAIFPSEQKPIYPALLPVKAKATDRFDLANKRLTKLLKKREESQEELSQKENPSVSPTKKKESDASEEKLATYQENQEIISIDPSSPENSEIPENKIPELNPTTLANTKIEPVGSSGKKAPIPREALSQGVRVQNDGRIYGKGTQSDKSNGRKALDGSRLRSYPVKKFSPPLTYRTVAPTKVASAPSILSHTLAELGPDTPVYVSARMGRWLEVISSSGGVGYIFEQDARQIGQGRN